jgi:hypothetical protein
VIVRILGEGQYAVADDLRPTLDKLDTALMEAVDSGDAFAPSDLVIPFADATLEETKGLLAEPGADPASDDH